MGLNDVEAVRGVQRFVHVDDVRIQHCEAYNQTDRRERHDER